MQRAYTGEGGEVGNPGEHLRILLTIASKLKIVTICYLSRKILAAPALVHQIYSLPTNVSRVFAL